MAKRKRKNRILNLFVVILVLIFIVIWGLVACQKNVFFTFYKNDTTKEQEVLATQSENQAASQAEVATSESSQQEEPTTETLVEDTTTVAGDTGQGSDGQEDTFTNVDPATLSNDSISWSFIRNSEHLPVTGYTQGIDMVAYSAYYKVDTEEKVIYLTFDEGYENGHTSDILDILKANEVQATFFVTKPYITSNPELCKRMKDEGHLVGNHSVTHRKFSTLTDEEIKQELEENQQTFEDVTGYEMDLFFRPPGGEYNERVLYDVSIAGYSTIFWSLAYKDWDVKNQPGKEAAYNHVIENYHPGGIFLLHAVSESNTEALDELLKALQAEGYRFGSLYEAE